MKMLSGPTEELGEKERNRSTSGNIPVLT